MNNEAYQRFYAYPQGNGGIMVNVDANGNASLPEPLAHLVFLAARFREKQ